MLSFQLFDPKSEDYEILQNLIAQVEFMVFDTEQLTAGMTLYDIEMSLESNPDFFSYFEKSDGVNVTKFDVERKLNNIKGWIYSKVREKSVGRKFARYR